MTEDERLPQLEEQLQAVFARVLTGEVTASDEFAELVLSVYSGRGGLINAIKDKCGITNHDEAKDELSSLVADLVLQLLVKPSLYDPDKAPLGAYITMALKRDIANLAEKRGRVKESPIREGDKDVGELVDRGNLQMTTEEQVIDQQLDLTTEERETGLRFIGKLAPDERICLELMDDRIKDNVVHADHLGIAHLPIEAQRKHVNNLKDRLKKKIKRFHDG